MIRTLSIIFLLSICASCDKSPTRETSTGQLIQVSSDDPEMIAAMQIARDTFGEFWKDVLADYQRSIPELSGSMVKAYFDDDGATEDGEHLWIEEVSYDGTLISGIVASEPFALSQPKLGEEVSFPMDRLSDWLIIEEGKASGAFTIQVLRNQMSETERAEHDANYPFSFSADK